MEWTQRINSNAPPKESRKKCYDQTNLRPVFNQMTTLKQPEASIAFELPVYWVGNNNTLPPNKLVIQRN